MPGTTPRPPGTHRSCPQHQQPVPVPLALDRAPQVYVHVARVRVVRADQPPDVRQPARTRLPDDLLGRPAADAPAPRAGLAEVHEVLGAAVARVQVLQAHDAYPLAVVLDA